MKRRKTRLTIGLLCLALSLVGAMAWAFQAHLHQEKLNAALLNAIDQGNPQAMRSLLARGADANGRWEEEPPPTFSLFVKQTLRISHPNSGRSLTPLMVAALDGNLETVQVLLNAGADVSARDEEGYTPLLWAVCNIWGGSGPIIRLLAAYGADIEARAKDGNTTWILARVNPEALRSLNQVAAKKTEEHGM